MFETRKNCWAGYIGVTVSYFEKSALKLEPADTDINENGRGF